MADKVGERPLAEILDRLYSDQKDDIALLTRGHLNHNRLWKPPDQTSHIPWLSAGKEVPLRHEPSPPLSPRRCSNDRRDQMIDAIYNFGAGASGSVKVPPMSQSNKKLIGRKTHRTRTPPFGKGKNKDLPSHEQQRPNTATSYLSDEVYVEELRLPELMLPVGSSETGVKLTHPLRTGSPKSLAPLGLDDRSGEIRVLRKQQFVESHLGGVTKKEQFSRFMVFQNEVMRRPDMLEKNVLSGRKAVEHLEMKLHEDLMKLDESVRPSGPNFQRLQIIGSNWDELIAMTPTYGGVLARIKDGYEDYMGSLLDTQSQKQSQTLMHQVERLESGTPVAPGDVRKAQEEVEQLEEEAKELLLENDRLRNTLREEANKLSNLPVPEPETETQQALRASQKHHDDKPQGIAEQILELHAGILMQWDEIQSLRQDLNENYVPVSICQNLEQCVRDTEADVLKVLSTNEYLEKTIQQLEADLEHLMAKSNMDPDESRKIWKSINMLPVPQLSGND